MNTALDETKLHAFVGKMLGDLGGALSVPTVRIGHRLGLFDILHQGPATAAELAGRAGGLHERYVREWALAQSCQRLCRLRSGKASRSAFRPSKRWCSRSRTARSISQGAFDVGGGR